MQLKTILNNYRKLKSFVYSNIRARRMIWFNFSQFYDYIASIPDYQTYVELGVWKGESIAYLAKQLKKRKNDVRIYGIDIFEDWNNNQAVLHIVPKIRQIFENTLLENKVSDMITPVKSISWEAASQFKSKSVDFVFIDADHSYESVKKDIEAWLPKIKQGGLISGHDYFNPCGVKQAVDEMFPDAQKDNSIGGVWYKKL